MPRLIFTQPGFTSKSCDLPEGSTRVGRSPSSDLIIRDESVSADHCEILVSWDEVIVREHGSTNGTWVGNARVNGQLPVNHHQLIRFGRVEARLELAGPSLPDATDHTGLYVLQRATQPTPPPPNPHVVIQPSNPAASPSNTSHTRITPPPNRPILPVTPSTPDPRPPLRTTGSPPPNRRRWIGILLLGTIVLAALFWWRYR